MKRHDFTPSELMQMAIKVMYQSVNEPRSDSKPSPKVGAVIHKPDGTVETACRGELRYGDHAEFTLLERKNRSNLVEGATLYSTLEPCAPGARNPPKLSCSERIVNARIKKVYVGIEDDDPNVARKGIKYLQDHGIEVEMFPAELQQQIREANQDFIRAALERASQETSAPHSDVLSPLESSAGDASDTLDGGALQLFSKALEKALEQPVDNLNPFLRRQGIYVEKNGKWNPSGIGILLFDKRPRDTFHQAGLLATVRYPDGKEEAKTFDGPMVLIPSELEEWLEKVLPHSLDRSHMQREQTLDLPLEIIREAVVNALVHRDYKIDTAKCQMVIDPSTIVIKSPGHPVSPITLPEMQDFSAPVLSRNPKLHYIFNILGLAEERGLGLRSFKALSAKHGLPAPRYTFEDPYLVLTIYRTVEAATQALPAEKFDQLSKAERKGWAWLSVREIVTTADYETAMEIPRRTALNHLKRFVDLGFLKKEGAGNVTQYRITRP